MYYMLSWEASCGIGKVFQEWVEEFLVQFRSSSWIALDWIYLARKHTPYPQPIRCQTNTACDTLTLSPHLGF